MSSAREIHFYSWRPPVCKVGDFVDAQMHQGPISGAEVMHIETYYTKGGEAYHVYAVRFEGHRRWQHLGEAAILSPLGGRS